MKTHYKEMDYRVDWMQDLFSALNHGFKSIQEKLNSVAYYDGVFAQEQAETIFGLAFVAAQTYITGTVSDMSEICGNKRIMKTQMLLIGSPKIANEITKILLINTIANYYKHYEEWDSWKAEGQNKKTIETLNICGISEKTRYPCHEAAQAIWPTEVLCDLNCLLNVLTEWRKNLLHHVKNT